MTRRPTLLDAFDPRANSLNALRVALAAVVIVSHAWPTGGFGEDPKLGGEGAGRWAVAGFFAISGFLVTGSRTQLGFGGYLARRAARILPGFWACLIVTAFAVAPVAAWLSGAPYDPMAALTYVGRNIALVILQPTIGDTLAHAPWQIEWNGSLWTLKWEFLAYIAIGVAWALPVLRRLRWPFAAGFLFLTAANLGAHLAGIGTRTETDALWLSTSFAGGVLLFLYRDRVRVDGRIALAAVAVIVAADLTETLSVFGELPIAYLMMYLAVVLPFQKAFARNDPSYGIYIYGFVVQQCLALAGVATWGGPAAMALLGIAVTVPVAYLSWWLVERPARDVVRNAFRKRALPKQADPALAATGRHRAVSERP
jgi:peptidoglycan/LPS O-acetylase OafA/YrhL